MKSCKKHGEVEPGSKNRCKFCRAEWSKKQRLDNPGKDAAQSKQYRTKYPDKAKAATQKWKAANKDRVKQAANIWRTNNPNKIRMIRIKNSYGLTAEEYENMVVQQDNKCVICDTDSKLVIDHCHTTGKVRGLLCHKCNVSIGYVEYLQKQRLLDIALGYLANEN